MSIGSSLDLTDVEVIVKITHDSSTISFFLNKNGVFEETHSLSPLGRGLSSIYLYSI